MAKSTITLACMPGEIRIGDVLTGLSSGEDVTVWEITSETSFTVKPWRWYHKYQLAVLAAGWWYWLLAGVIFIMEKLQ